MIRSSLLFPFQRPFRDNNIPGELGGEMQISILSDVQHGKTA